jgi:hypothetical protein
MDVVAVLTAVVKEQSAVIEGQSRAIGLLTQRVADLERQSGIEMH